MSGLPAVVTILDLGTGSLSSSAVFPASMTAAGVATTLGITMQQIASAVVSATIVPVPSGGTNTSTLTADGVLYGNGSSTVGITAAGGTSLPLLGQGAGNAPVFAVLPVIGGGTNTTTLTAFGVVFGNGSSTVGITAFGTSGLPLIGNGSASAPSFGVAAVPGGGTNTSTLTANSVLYGNGTSTVGLLTAGATGQMLMGQGTAAAPVMQYPGMTLLNTLTALGVASVSDLASINATFNDYMFVAENIVPSALTTVLMRVQVGGTIQTASYVGSFSNGIDLTNGSSIASTAGAGFSGVFYLLNANSTAANKIISGRGFVYSSPTTAVISNTGGAYNGSQGAVTGVSFMPSGGTFTGTFRIYGMRTT